MPISMQIIWSMRIFATQRPVWSFLGDTLRSVYQRVRRNIRRWVGRLTMRQVRHLTKFQRYWVWVIRGDRLSISLQGAEIGGQWHFQGLISKRIRSILALVD